MQLPLASTASFLRVFTLLQLLYQCWPIRTIPLDVDRRLTQIRKLNAYLTSADPMTTVPILSSSLSLSEVLPMAESLLTNATSLLI